MPEPWLGIRQKGCVLSWMWRAEPWRITRWSAFPGGWSDSQHRTSWGAGCAAPGDRSGVQLRLGMGIRTTPLWACGVTPCEGSHRILFCRDLSGWTMPMGRAHASLLCQSITVVEFYRRDMGIAGLASAWAMARRKPKEYRRKVDAAMHCSGVCPHT